MKSLIRNFANLLTLVGLGLMLSLSSMPTVAGTVNFTADTTNRLQGNPEKGFYFHLQPSEFCNSVGTNIRDDLAGFDTKARLMYYDYTPSGSSVATFASAMTCARSIGVKTILAIAYCFSFGCNEGVSLAQAVADIAALKSTLYANRDVIAYCRVSSIGGWGEGATWQGDQNNPVPANVKSAILAAMFDACPPEVMLTHRNAPYIQTIYPSVLTNLKAFRGTQQSRLGTYNDCFMAGPDDSSTFPGASTFVQPNYTQSQASQRTYAAALTEYAPFGFETCPFHQPADYSSSRTNCFDINDGAGNSGGIMNEGPRYHVTYGNRAYDDTFHNQWMTDGCYGQVDGYMGYRIQLDSMVSPSTATRGAALNVPVNLRNTGWARVFSHRLLYVTLKKSGASDIDCKAQPLSTLPSQATKTYSMTASCTIPGGATPGVYNIYIKMPDANASIANRPEYMIQPANAAGSGASFDATARIWNTGQTITIN